MQGLTKADEIYMLSYRMKRLKEILQLILRTIKLMGITYTFMHIHNAMVQPKFHVFFCNGSEKGKCIRQQFTRFCNYIWHKFAACD